MFRSQIYSQIVKVSKEEEVGGKCGLRTEARSLRVKCTHFQFCPSSVRFYRVLRCGGRKGQKEGDTFLFKIFIF